MMKKIAKTIMVIVSICLLMTTLNTAIVANNGENTQNIKLDIITRDKDSNGNSIFSYLTGKEIRPQADILVSGTDVNYPNGKLVLKVPKTTTNGIKLTKPTFISSREAESSVESETDTHYIMTYTYRQIKGGLIGTYDFPIRFPNEITTNGDTIPVVWEMQDVNGNVIRTVSKTFTAIAYSTWTTDKVIFDNHNLVTNDDPWVGNPRTDGFQELRLHFTDKAVRTHTSANVDNTNKVNYYIDAVFEPQSGKETQYGIYNPQTITFIDKIPVGGTFEHIDLEHHARLTGAKVISKEYNETTREVKMKVEVSKMQDLWGKDNRRGLRAHVYISYRNQPIDTIHKNIAQVIMDEGLASEQILNEAAWSIKFRDFYYKSQTPSGFTRSGNFHFDTFREWNYTYNPETEKVAREGSEATKGLLYSTLLHGYHNGSGFNDSTGIYTAVKNVLYRQLDPRLYVSSFSFSTWELTDRERNALNNTPNKLWGIKENGDRILLAENIKVQSDDLPRSQWDIEINDTTQQYKQILLEWPETPLILDNDVQYLDMFMKPIASEVEKFKNFEYTETQRYEIYTSSDYELIHNYATIEKNDNNEFYVKSGQLPKNATLNTSTGEITIPKDQLITKSAISASSSRITPAVTSSSRSLVRVNDTSLGTPVISFTDDHTVYVYPNLDTRVKRTEVVFSHASGERTTLIAEKSETGWAITSSLPEGVAIDQLTGLITIQANSIIADSDINAIHKGENIDGERIYARTVFVDSLNRTIIRPSTPSIHSTDTSIVIKPNLADTRSFTFDYSPVVKSLADYQYTDLTSNEVHLHNNWNKIEFPWIKARLENGNDHNIYYSSAPGANHRELFTRGLVGGSWPANDFTANYKTITLLPAGVNFVRDAGVGIKHNASNATAPEVIENFRGTGRTAVIYTFDLTKKATVNDAQHLNGAYHTNKFIVDITGQAEDGDNIVEHFLVWDRDNIIKPNHNAYKDVLDLDGDGDTENDVFIRTTNRLTLILPYEVSGKKQVSIDKVNWTLTAPPQDIGNDVFYRINAVNNSIRSLPNFKIFDVLPAIDDHKIIENENGEYLPRGTQFVTPMVKAIEDIPENASLLQKWNFYYSLQPQGQTFESAYNVEWKTKDDITDWSAVKAIKIELKQGQEFLPKEEINVIVHAQIPYDKTMPIFQKSYNSFAISTLGDNYAEVNEVISTNIKYEVDGVIFFDLDEDGVRDENEALLEGYTLTLVDANGVPYIDRGTQAPITATSDKNGFYHMDVYERGEYYVKVSKKHGDETFTPEQYKIDATDERGAPIKVLKPGTKLSVDGVIGNDTTQNSNDESSGLTAKFKLNPVTRIATRNAGIIISKGDITLVKKSEVITNNEGNIIHSEKLLSNVTFELLKDNVVIDTQTTDENGKLVFSEKSFGTYEIREKSTQTPYILNTNKIQAEITKNTPYITLDIRNEYKKGTISLLKKDADTKTPLAGVTFALRHNNVEYMRAVTDINGVATFNNVAYGNYEVVEIETLISHIADTTTKYPVSITDNNQTVYLLENNTPIFNAIKKGVVTFKKVDKDTQLPLQGVVFALQQNGETVYTATSNEAGIVRFENVKYGEYQVKEIATLDSHLMLDNPTIGTVFIEQNEQVIDLNIIENTVKKSSIEITKVDADNKSIKLAGIKFELRKENNVVDTQVTNQNGIAIFENVRYGDYTIVEVATLENYNLDSTPINVEVRNNNEVIKKEKINQMIKGSVEIVKVDAENPTIKLAGVTFVLKQGEIEKYTAVTNEQGFATFNNVVYGDYILSEKSTLENYNLSNETRNVQIRSHGEKISLGQFTNQMIKGNVKVIKTDSENQQTVIPGVTFGLLQNGEIKYQATSNVNGVVLFENVVYGGYVLKELSGPKNYTINPEQVGVLVVENGVTVDLGTYKNKKIYGSAQLLKLDAQTKQPLAGVEFTLEKADGSKVTAISDHDGKVIFQNLEYGGYVVTETKPLAGYISSERQYGIVVTEDGQVFDIGTVENKRIVGHVFLRKFDTTTNTALSGVEFTLYNQNNDEVAKAISDDEGNVNFKNVEYGIYTIKETKSLLGYKLSNETFGVIISENGVTVDLGTVYNQKIRGSVVLRKIDFETKQPLAGVQFTITDEIGATTTATSDNEGIVRFDGLEYGTYRITESKPLSGYVASMDEFTVTIQDDGEVIVLGDITNKKIVKPVVNTNDSTFSFVTWMLLSLFGLYYLKKYTK